MGVPIAIAVLTFLSQDEKTAWAAHLLSGKTKNSELVT
jgi:hypothetical protein